MPLSDAKQLIRERLGLRFEGASERYLRRALEQRIEATAAPSLADYLALLRRRPAELTSLATLLTINETYFDREPHHLDLICEQLLPRLLASPGVTRPVRILSLGCSSGEEPYSVAIRVHERWGARAASLVQITGADVDAERIRQARIGCYQGQAFRALAPERKERWFRQQDAHGYRLCEPIRNAVSFQVLNVLDAALAETLGLQHIVLYRNISIYFDAETRARVLRQIKQLLHAEGFLIVGTTEVLANDIGRFATRLQQGIWYFANQPASDVSPAVVAPPSRISAPSSASSPAPAPAQAQAQAQAQKRPHRRRTAQAPRAAGTVSWPLPRARPQQRLSLFRCQWDKRDTRCVRATSGP